MNSTGNVMDSPLHSSSPIKSQDQRNETTARSETDKRNGQRTSKPLQNKTKTKLKKKKLKFMTINCDGLKGKQRQNYLATIIDEEQPDIIMGQESKLDGTYTDAEVFPDGYLVKRKDRNKSGGGVFIAYRDSLVVSEVKGVGKDCELVVLKVEVWKSSPIYIASFYRQPNRDTASLLSLQADLEKLFKNQSVPKLLLCGDFNLPSINWQDYSVNDNPQYGLLVNECMLDIVEAFHLEQQVSEPTRLNNVLDLILTTMPDSVGSVNIVPGMSDHEGVPAECETNIQTNKKQPRTVFIHRKANKDRIEEDLKQFSEEFMSSCKDRNCSENWELFKDSIKKAMEDHIPTKVLSGRWNLPWMNNTIKRPMKKRRRRYDAWKKYGDKADLTEYNKLKQEVQSALKQAHNNYVDGIFEEDQGSSNPGKRLWSYIKSLKIDKIGIPSLLYENKLVSKPKQKAEALAQQYKSVFTTEDTSYIPSKGPGEHSKMPSIDITTNGVEKLLAGLNPRKAAGPDQVSTWMLKNFSSILAPALCEIFKQSLHTGDVPVDWKTAHITAIFKKGERCDLGNYRPVSLTSVTCKMMEHILASNIRQHLDDQSILSKYQHGFRKKTTVVRLKSSLRLKNSQEALTNESK